MKEHKPMYESILAQLPAASHIEAIIRGWYPHWISQLRIWSAQDWAIWSAFLLAASMTVRTLVRAK